RYLTNSFSLAYVTSSIADLADLCHHAEIRQSPFFNVFSTLHLSLLMPDEARDLLVRESEGAGRRFGEDEIAFVTRLAGSHPFHVQQAANALWEAHAPLDSDAVRAAFLDDAAPHFRYAVAQLTASQVRVLRAAATGEALSREDAAD